MQGNKKRDNAPGENISQNSLKPLLHVVRRPSRRGNEGHTEPLRQRPCVGVAAVRAVGRGEVGLVSYEDAPSPLDAVAVDFVKPDGLDGANGRTVRKVAHNGDGMGAAVVGGGEGAEALLAGRVPDLELAAAAVNGDGADLEVDADGGDGGVAEDVVGEAGE